VPRQNRTIPLNWNPEAIRLLSLIAPADEDLARIWWEQFAPEAYRALMDSKLLDGFSVPNVGWSEEELAAYLNDVLLDSESQRNWYAAGLLLFFIGGQYWRSTGRRVAWSLIRSSLDRAISRSSSGVAGLCDKLRSGSVSLADWQSQMATMIKTTTLASAMAAAGGAGGMTPGMLELVQSKIAEQLGYLQEFASRIASGIPLDGNICRVMQLYLNGARGIFHIIEGDRYGRDGYTEYRNVLGPTEEHCTGSGSCLEATEAGWSPLGTLPAIGSRICLSNCLCQWQYRRLEGYDELGDPVYTVV
jgi:hypothetical protein